MDLLPSPEQLEIVDVVGRFLKERFPTSRLRETRHEPSSFDPAVWRECGELGWFALGLPEAFGGVGYGMAEEALVFREIGRSLATGPFVATALAARVAAVAGNTELAAAIASGAAPVALAEPRGAAPTMAPAISGDFHVLDGPGATHLLVVSGGTAAIVDAAVTGSITPIESIDEGTRIGKLTMKEVTPVVALHGDEADEIARRGTVLVSAMLVGIAEATRDLAAEHAKNRVQFGKPIGVNQAIKHPCADMAVRAEAASSQLVFAALSIDEQADDEPFQVETARVVATGAAIKNAAACLQVHGGMGYTFEHDSNLYVKRARVLDRMLGLHHHHLTAVLAATPPA